MALVDVFLVHPIAHGVAAEVHVGGGLEQKQFAAFKARLCHKAVATVVEGGAYGVGKGVEHRSTGFLAAIAMMT